METQAITCNVMPPTPKQYRKHVDFLTVEEELELIRLAQSDDDKASKLAKAKLLKQFEPYIKSIVKPFAKYPNLDYSDLMQEASIGFMIAIDRFNPVFQCRLATYSKLWIKSYVQLHMMHHLHQIKYPSTGQMRFLFFTIGRMTTKINENYTASQLCADVSKEFNVPENIVYTMLNQNTAFDSLNRETRPGFSVADRLGSEENVENNCYEHEIVALQTSTLDKALRDLSPREVEILKARFTDKAASLETLGARFSISKERVRQIQQKALAKLAKKLKDKKHILLMQ